MDKKCSKYEGLFLFSDKDTLEKHIETCEECQQEHEKMQKVSELVNEVKFYYLQKAKQRRKLKSICAAICLIIMSVTVGIGYNDTDLQDALMYGNELSAEDLGFPVDSYGLLMVDE